MLRPIVLLFLATSTLRADIVISANENKVDLSSGSPKVLQGVKPDNLTVLDLQTSPPGIQQIDNVPNSVIGPPSTVAIAPDESLAVVASPLQIDPATAELVPDNVVRVVDLRSSPPKVVAAVKVGKQPTGVAISPDGKLALIVNRAEASVSVVAIQGKESKLVQTLTLGDETDELCAVAMAPSGTMALVTNRSKSLVHFLSIDKGRIEETGEPLTAYGQIYHVEISPDGRFGMVAGGGSGFGSGALTVLDLKADPVQVVDVVMLGTTPESFNISPDGKLVAAVVMNDSNVASDHPRRTENGLLIMLQMTPQGLSKVQEVPIGRIPQGVVFSPDGKLLLLQCHASREIWVFKVQGAKVQDTGKRIPVPGFPSSLAASRR
jgi:DNA-binding beta-propeller fold protein YncE